MAQRQVFGMSNRESKLFILMQHEAQQDSSGGTYYTYMHMHMYVYVSVIYAWDFRSRWTV